jgi:hypothetical protein
VAALFAARRTTVLQLPSLKAVCSWTSTVPRRAGWLYLYEGMVGDGICTGNGMCRCVQAVQGGTRRQRGRGPMAAAGRIADNQVPEWFLSFTSAAGLTTEEMAFFGLSLRFLDAMRCGAEI